jgi:hypothetical protein
MSIFRNFAIFILFAASAISISNAQPYSPADYKLQFGIAIENGTDSSVVLRSFMQEKQVYFLVVNPRTLHTAVLSNSALLFVPENLGKIAQLFSKSAYIKASKEAVVRSNQLQNAGIIRLPKIAKGVDLTIDLCPSKLPLDKDFFVELVNTLKTVQRPVPLAISITGSWMKGHPKDFAWLLLQEKEGNISITWINHSYHHRVSKDLPLKENFLLEKGTKISDEILLTEKALLNKGVVPSPFFRFPGLVSDRAVFDSVLAYGLIPIGSDAWLAKNQKPQSGSIVLVHGNGNEPIGLKKFEELLTSQRDSILAGRWILFDLRESMAADEQP